MLFAMKLELATPQRRLGPAAFLASALGINMMAIMAVDMYTPALPGLTRELSVSASTLNLTMFAFFFMSALGVFVAAPVSDRFGRRPMILAGSILFAAGSAACAVAGGIALLVAGRVLQALGYGAIIAVETAMMKDAFAGASLQFAMTLLQSFVVIGPVIAPFLGTFMLSVAGWRDIFWLLAAMGAACTVLSLLISETLPTAHRTAGGVASSLAQSIRTFGTLLSGKRFTSLATTLALAAVPYMAFLAVVPYILLDEFGTGYLEYSIIYAVIALGSVAAPFIYLRMSHGMGTNQMLGASIAACILSSALMLTCGRMTPAGFCIAFMPFVLAEGVIRPMSFVILLDQPPERVGAASSLVNLMYSIFGSAGTVLATAGWPNFTLGLGVILAGCTTAMAATGAAFALSLRNGNR